MVSVLLWATKKGAFAKAGVVVTLAVVFGSNRYVVGLAFDNGQRGLAVGLVGDGTPYNEIGPGAPGAAPGHFFFLGYLFQVVSVFVQQNEQIFLADVFFRRFDKPSLADVAPYLAVFTQQPCAVLGDILGFGLLDSGLCFMRLLRSFLCCIRHYDSFLFTGSWVKHRAQNIEARLLKDPCCTLCDGQFDAFFLCFGEARRGKNVSHV